MAAPTHIAAERDDAMTRTTAGARERERTAPPRITLRPQTNRNGMENRFSSFISRGTAKPRKWLLLRACRMHRRITTATPMGGYAEYYGERKDRHPGVWKLIQSQKWLNKSRARRPPGFRAIGIGGAVLRVGSALDETNRGLLTTTRSQPWLGLVGGEGVAATKTRRKTEPDYDESIKPRLRARS